jgi:hypothetical protein
MVRTGGVLKSSRAVSADADLLERTPYSECRAQDCTFNVTAQDATCPNCGIPKPYRERPVTELAVNLSSEWVGCYVILSIFALAIVLTVVSVNIVGRVKSPVLFVIVIMAVSIATPLLVYRHLRRKAGLIMDRPPDTEAPASMSLTLKSSEAIIEQRVRELKERDQQLGAVMTRARQNKGEQWDRVRRTLTEALDTVRGQSTRYQMKLTEIKLVRWQNRLAPMLYGWEGLSFNQNEARLKALEAKRTIGAEIEAKVAQYRKDLGDAPDVRELARRLEETIASYEKVHEGLVARQAVLALQGISPVSEALSPSSYPTGGKREGEVFNAQVAITDFSSSFAELEAEYTRLQSESDVAQEIGRILERTGPA